MTGNGSHSRRRDKAINPIAVLILPCSLCSSVIGWESKRYQSFALVVNLVSLIVLVASFMTSVIQYIMIFSMLFMLCRGETESIIGLMFMAAGVVGHILIVAAYMALVEMCLMLADIEENTRGGKD